MKITAEQAAESESGDWVVLEADGVEEFIGYDWLSTDVKITRYRKVVTKNHTLYHLVFNLTPFYAESGGQVGDRGVIENDLEKVEKDTDRDRFMTAEEAKEYGLIDNVIEHMHGDE